jgi:hypothetical protein
MAHKRKNRGLIVASTKNDALLNLMAMRNAPSRKMFFSRCELDTSGETCATRRETSVGASQVMTEKLYGDQIFSKQTDFGIQPIKIGRGVNDG